MIRSLAFLAAVSPVGTPSTAVDDPDQGRRASLTAQPLNPGDSIWCGIRSTETGSLAVLLGSLGNGPTLDPVLGLTLRLDPSPLLVGIGTVPATGRLELIGPDAPHAGTRVYLQGLVESSPAWIATQPLTVEVRADAPPQFSRQPSLGPFRALSSGDVDPGDLDGDGDDDLVLAGPSGVVVLLNEGPGRLLPAPNAPPPWQTPGRTRDAEGEGTVELGDVDLDGDLDLFHATTATASHGPLQRLLRNDGSGRFVEQPFPRASGADARDVAFGDLDGDGDLDLVIARGSGAHSRGPGSVDELYVGDGRGRYVEHRPFRTAPWNEPGATSASVSLGDVDGDGDLDLYFATYDFAAGGATNVLLRNDGGLRFVDLSANLPDAPGDDNATGCEFVDVDEDGHLDLLLSHSVLSTPGIALQLGDGQGSFRSGAGQFPALTGVDVGIRLGMAIGDADDDGDVDVLYCVHELGIPPGECLLVVNSGGAQGGRLGHSHLDPDFRTEGRLISPDAAFFDLEGDGDQDLYVLNTGSFSGDPDDRLLLNDR